MSIARSTPSVDLLQNSRDGGDLKVMDGGNQVETKPETSPAISIPLGQNAEDLQLSDDVLNQDPVAR